LARVDASASASAPPAAPPAPQGDMVNAMVARLAERLQKDGSDVDGWIKLVRSYTVLKQPDKARAAQNDARKALAADPDKLARLETGIKAVESGAPPPDEQDAAPAQSPEQMVHAMVARLAARLQKDGSDVDGWIQLVRSYTVLKETEQARVAEDDARKALKDDPAKLARLETGLKDIAAGAAAANSDEPPVAPGAASANANPQTTPAAPAQSAQPQDQMIRGMVERLAARLHQDGSDVDGWLRLLRSYMVLGEGEKARAAMVDARNALKDDADKLRRLDEGAKSLGVGG
jgi:cytochrome c-type biogenesis protein CcmH/NrfG